MKYNYVISNGRTKELNIPDEWLEKQERLLSINRQEAIELWLSDEGYEVNEVVEELTAKAKANKTGVKGATSTKPRKKPERKPDLVKRELISFLHETLADNDLDLDCGTLKDVLTANPERVITFSLGSDKYELTLSKKRKPKS